MTKHPMIDKPAPALALTNAKGETYTLPIGQKPIALFFFPKAFSSFCTAEACAFRDAQANNTVFKRYPHLEVIGISTDPVDRLASFADENGLAYTMLSDSQDEGRKAYQVNKQLFGLTPGRETFFIDAKGIVRGVHDRPMSGTSHAKFIEKILTETDGGKA